MIGEIIIAVVLLLNYGYVESGTNPLTIAGGSNTSIEAHKFMVFILILTDRTYFLRCGGSLISEGYAITAAHCVYNIDPFQMLVHVGSSHPRSPAGRKCLAEIIEHEHYDSQTQTNDISLLRLYRCLTYDNNSIGGINLPTVQGINFTDETSLTVIGYDVKENNLKEANLWIVYDTLCERAYRITLVSQFCAANVNISLEFRDEGSPVVYNNELIGIVSRTADNVNQEGITVLVKVANYLEFIRRGMNNTAP